MNQKERDKLKRIEPVQQGLLGTAQAAQMLDLTQRQVQRILKDYQARGGRAVVHGARGRTPNNASAAEVRQQARELLQTRYHDFGPTLAAEHLADDDGLSASRETIDNSRKQTMVTKAFRVFFAGFGKEKWSDTYRLKPVRDWSVQGTLMIF